LVAGVWVGNADNKPMGGSSSLVAAPIWREFMTAALKDKPVVQFPVPGGVEFANVCESTGGAPAGGCKVVKEVFLSGRLPQGVKGEKQEAPAVSQPVRTTPAPAQPTPRPQQQPGQPPPQPAIQPTPAVQAAPPGVTPAGLASTPQQGTSNAGLASTPQVGVTPAGLAATPRPGPGQQGAGPGQGGGTGQQGQPGVAPPTPQSTGNRSGA
jgi:membrane peptidoglycan carboxypeptidase